MSPPFRDTRPHFFLQGATSSLASASSPAPSSLSALFPGRNTCHGLWRGVWAPFWSVVPTHLPSVPSASTLPAGSCLPVSVPAVPSAQKAFACSLPGVQLSPHSLSAASSTASPCSQPGRAGAPSLLPDALCAPSSHPPHVTVGLGDGSPPTTPSSPSRRETAT